jgi:hypothetical protein
VNVYIWDRDKLENFTIVEDIISEQTFNTNAVKYFLKSQSVVKPTNKQQYINIVELHNAPLGMKN